MIDDILLNKAQTIERCIKRIQEEYTGAEELKNNYTKQDAIILNIQRACEAAIDMGIRVIRIKHIGNPQTSREVFTLLEQQHLISPELSSKMQAMVGFRNIAVHDYANLNLEIVKSIAENNLSDLLSYSQQLIDQLHQRL